jgi:hypothetical protein
MAEREFSRPRPYTIYVCGLSLLMLAAEGVWARSSASVHSPVRDGPTSRLIAQTNAASSWAIGARPLPALVIPPRLTFSPAEFSEGTRPKYPLARADFETGRDHRAIGTRALQRSRY